MQHAYNPRRVSGEALQDDPVFGPYFKMLKVGVPRPAVDVKMRNKGLDPAV